MDVTVIPGQGFESNIYLLKAERPALVDTGTGFSANQIIKHIERAIPLSEISVIILTHEHFDHIGGLSSLLDKIDPEVIMHQEGAALLEGGHDLSATMFGARQPAVTVTRRVADGDYIQLGDVRLSVLYTPGHSPGSMCLYHAETQSLFSGDTIFADGGIGRTDLPGGNAALLRESIYRIAKLKVKNLYTGHGSYVKNQGHTHVIQALRTIDYIIQ